MPLAFLLLFALLQADRRAPEPVGLKDSNCGQNVEGRLVFPAYATPLFHIRVVVYRIDPPCSLRDTTCEREVYSGPEGFFQLGVGHGNKYEFYFQVEGMEIVQQVFELPDNISPGRCFPTPGFHVDVLLHPAIKPSAMAITEDTVGIEDLARKTPARVVRAFEKSMDKKPKADSKETSATLLEVLKTAPDFYKANLELGLEYKKQGQREDSIQALTHALDVNSGSMLARFALGQYSYEAGDFQKAAALLSSAVRLGNTSSSAYYMLGASYVQLGQLDLAEAGLLRALAIAPTVVKAHMQLYNVYMMRQQPDKALQEADTYLEEYPDAPDREVVQSMADKLRKTLKPQP